MKQIKRKNLSLALATATARRTAISVAIGMCLSGVVYAQAQGNIVGQTRAGATVTVTSTSDAGLSRTLQAGSNGSFTISNLPAGRYRVVADGVTREVNVTGGADARVGFTGDSPVQGERVTVTGSRIARDTFNSVSPVQIITREESTLAGFASTTDVLQSGAVTGGGSQINNAYGGFVVDGGPGVNTLGLRGLGATRTLVLLNGRRVAPAGTRGAVGSADLNVLPNAIIDHIEILKDGASSIYGSDAVAGVVNIITKKNIQGLTLEGQYNAPEDGGGEQQRYSATYGRTFDRGFISASAELYRRSHLTLGDREWTKCNTDYLRRAGGLGDYGSGDFIDPVTGKPKCYPITITGSNGVTINTIGTGTLAGVGAAGSVGTSFNRWRPNSGVTTGLVGFEGVGGGANSLGVRDTFAPYMLNNSLISPAEIKTAFVQGAFDLRALGAAELYGEALFHQRESRQVDDRQLTLDYARGSPLIPVGLRGVPNLQAAPTLLTAGQPLQVRAFIGFGNYTASQELEYWKTTGGIRGNLPFSDWKYDANVSFAKSDASYTFETWLTDRLAQSMDVVASGSGFACRNPANGCVAAPVLSSALIGGVIPQAWRDWTFVPDTGNTQYEETTVNLGMTGSLFTLPAGRVRSAVGFEYRRAEIDDTPSLDSQGGNLYNLTSAAITRGSDSVKEIYGEIEVPILAGMRGAEELTLNASGRWTDYKSYGSDTTYKIGLLYSPVKWLSFRATNGTSYRAPALFEQYLGSTSGFLGAANDPCNEYGVRDPNSPRYRNCASEGLPGTFTQTGGIQVNASGGAAAGLKAETSENTTLGIIFQPSLRPGMGSFSFAVDYYKIRVDDGVDRVGGGSILTLCYNDPQFRAGGGYCRLVTRGTAASPTALVVNDSYINVSTDQVRGFDYTLRYQNDIGPGNLLINAQLTRYLERSSKLFSDDPLENVVGQLYAPKRTASMDVQYKYREWRVRYGVDFLDKMSDYDLLDQDPATSIYKMDTPAQRLHHLSLQYTADKWSVTGGVRNLANRVPPSISSYGRNKVGNTLLYSGFDYFGRTYFVNATKTF